MSWAALNEQLAALLPRFAVPIDPAAAENLMSEAMGLGGSDGAVARLQDSGLRPTASEADALKEWVMHIPDQAVQRPSGCLRLPP